VVPKFRKLKEPEKLTRYVTDEDFKSIYEACEHAHLPRLPGEHYTPAEWWRALITMAHLTGWRISEPLKLRRSDLDLDAGVAITRARDNKAKRDERVPLHPFVIEHLRGIVSYTEAVFP
jgi:integrase